MTNHLIILFLITTLLVLPIAVSAQDNVGFPLIGRCVDNQTLETTLNLLVNGTAIPVVEQNITCSYGCVNTSAQYGGECADRSIERSFITTIVLFVLAGILFVLSFVTQNVMRTIFLFVAMLFLIAASYITADITKYHYVGISNVMVTVYYALIVIFILMLTWLFFSFIKDMLFMNSKERKNESDGYY